MSQLSNDPMAWPSVEQFSLWLEDSIKQSEPEVAERLQQVVQLMRNAPQQELAALEA